MSNAYVASKLLVAWDLNYEIRRPKLLEAVKTSPWAMLSESSYVIETGETPEQVFRRLDRFIDGNDRLAVVSLGSAYYGQLPNAVHQWLQLRLPVAA